MADVAGRRSRHELGLGADARRSCRTKHSARVAGAARGPGEGACADSAVPARCTARIREAPGRDGHAAAWWHTRADGRPCPGSGAPAPRHSGAPVPLVHSDRGSMCADQHSRGTIRPARPARIGRASRPACAWADATPSPHPGSSLRQEDAARADGRPSHAKPDGLAACCSLAAPPRLCAWPAASLHHHSSSSSWPSQGGGTVQCLCLGCEPPSLPTRYSLPGARTGAAHGRGFPLLAQHAAPPVPRCHRISLAASQAWQAPSPRRSSLPLRPRLAPAAAPCAPCPVRPTSLPPTGPPASRQVLPTTTFIVSTSNLLA